MQTLFTYGSRKSAVTPKTILFGAVIRTSSGLFLDTATGNFMTGADYERYLKEQAAKIQQVRDLKAVAEKAKVDEQRRIYDQELADVKQKAIDDFRYEEYLKSPSKEGSSKNSNTSTFSKLILPIGAGIAALFFLKGH